MSQYECPVGGFDEPTAEADPPRCRLGSRRSGLGPSALAPCHSRTVVFLTVARAFPPINTIIRRAPISTDVPCALEPRGFSRSVLALGTVRQNPSQGFWAGHSWTNERPSFRALPVHNPIPDHSTRVNPSYNDIQPLPNEYNVITTWRGCRSALPSGGPAPVPPDGRKTPNLRSFVHCRYEFVINKQVTQPQLQTRTARTRRAAPAPAEPGARCEAGVF
ncbi:hypothetical protein EVAR_87011_1 [Eumeta japonica]|uniref:Uncharacterized protein n=1 Tax=Eumeta variegata TaxID=151549 RepID=A0A4C1W9F5_EUMVA|nr:hypothetical protein EVAR_87011_1 [Eumeta japonica]